MMTFYTDTVQQQVRDCLAQGFLSLKEQHMADLEEKAAALAAIYNGNPDDSSEHWATGFTGKSNSALFKHAEKTLFMDEVDGAKIDSLSKAATKAFATNR